ncbi:thiamine pyrophosphate-binding protein [Thermophilibacter sp.]
MKGYTNEENVRMLVALLKQFGIKRIVASPGTTNITFVASVQGDSFFEVISSVDERSAAYIACGMAAESGEPVVLSCTGATASRNYTPGLTEAFYRKLPILAVTSMQHPGRIGQYVPQVLDRSTPMADVCVKHVRVTVPHSDEDVWACNLMLNEALLALTRDGGGPVHIDLQTEYSRDFSTRPLPRYREIRRYTVEDSLPTINAQRIAIVVGAHMPFSADLTEAIEGFCGRYDAVVLCDQTSNYRGNHRVLAALVTNQDASLPDIARPDLLIYIGSVSGASLHIYPSEVWRVNPDGEIRDCYRKQTAVFEMSERFFFAHYAGVDAARSDATKKSLQQWNKVYKEIVAAIPELPFSNLWIAQHTAPRLPDNSVLHLGILNSLRAWNMFETPESVACYANTGGFGIDGVLSTTLGASLASPEKLFFCVLGDLAFFYDLNVLGNRHLCSNIRILLVNNGRGTEFRNYVHPAAQFGDEADAFMAAAGHFGDKSRTLVKNFASDLGFKYLSASGKEEYLECLPQFISPENREKPMVLEVFTDSQNESDALEAISSIAHDSKGAAKQLVKKALGQKGVDMAKKILGR